MHGERAASGEGLTILWVGVDPGPELRRALREVGLGVTRVAAARDALPRLAAYVHDVVVVSLPGAPPGEAVREVRGGPGVIAHAWVVALVDDPEHVGEAVAAGAHDVTLRAPASELCRWLVSCARAAVSGCDRPAALEALAARTAALGRRVAALGQENRTLRELSSQDDLTGLTTRVGLDAQLQRAVQLGGRTGQPVAMILCDVDGLARLNDEHGRAEGDATLRRLAGILAANIRGCDLAARRGDDEFAVVLPSTPVAHAVRVAERIRARAERELGGLDRRVTVSIGVAAFEPTGAIRDARPGSESLLEAAYRALRLAKRKGGNRIESAAAFFEPGDDDQTPIVIPR